MFCTGLWRPQRNSDRWGMALKSRSTKQRECLRNYCTRNLAPDGTFVTFVRM
jgi:allophanate hydrolase subunit 2